MNFEICAKMRMIVRDFLSYDYLNFPKQKGYIGFETGGLC